jgi:putative ABC transport system substrate-binding protein
MKKWRLAQSFLFAFTLLSVTACGQQSPTGSDNKNSTPAAGENKQVKVGIVQIVEHPALDAARDGFIAQMAKNGFEKDKQVVYDVKSAQGNMDTAISIAQKFQGDKVDLILAIATPAAQAAAQTTKDIPILFTAVTDPVAAGLVKSKDKP